MISRTLTSLATAAVLSIGVLASTGSAQAGYGHGYHAPRHHYVKVYHHRHYCFYRTFKVWTYYGPKWVSKRVCH